MVTTDTTHCEFDYKICIYGFQGFRTVTTNYAHV
jgi:hypothetical protein